MGKAGWVGYKLQVCETAPEEPRKRGEPTPAVITALLTQPATASDNGSLTPVLAKHTQTAEPPPESVFADAGYINANELEMARTAGYELCGPIGAPPHSGARFGSDSFEVDIPNRRAICPAGKCSSECSRIHEAARESIQYYFAWPKADCANCPLANQCLSKRRLVNFERCKSAKSICSFRRGGHSVEHRNINVACADAAVSKEPTASSNAVSASDTAATEASRKPMFRCSSLAPPATCAVGHHACTGSHTITAKQ